MVGVSFLGSLLMGKGTCAPRCPLLSPMASPPLSGPAACVPSLGCTSLALTLAPAPAAPKQVGSIHPSLPPSTSKVASPRGPPSCIHFHTSIISLEESSSELRAAGARLRRQRGPCGSVPLATHCLLWERPQMPLHSHGRVMTE